MKFSVTIAVAVIASLTQLASSDPQGHPLAGGYSGSIFPTQPRTLPPIIPPYRPQLLPVKEEYASSSFNRNTNIYLYKYKFETDTGIAAQAEALNAFPLVSSGSFSWTSPEGQKVAITYEANETGYHPTGDAIPTPHPQIVRALEYIAKHANNKI